MGTWANAPASCCLLRRICFGYRKWYRNAPHPEARCRMRYSTFYLPLNDPATRTGAIASHLTVCFVAGVDFLPRETKLRTILKGDLETAIGPGPTTVSMFRRGRIAILAEIDGGSRGTQHCSAGIPLISVTNSKRIGVITSSGSIALLTGCMGTLSHMCHGKIATRGQTAILRYFEVVPAQRPAVWLANAEVGGLRAGSHFLVLVSTICPS